MNCSTGDGRIFSQSILKWELYSSAGPRGHFLCTAWGFKGVCDDDIITHRFQAAMRSTWRTGTAIDDRPDKVFICDQCYGNGVNLSWALFFQWLGVTRTSDPPVPCGHRVSCCVTFSMLIRKGMASHALPINVAGRVIVSQVQSHSRGGGKNE